MTRETNMAVGTRNGAGHGHSHWQGTERLSRRNGNGTYDCWQPARVGLFLPVPLFGVRSTGGTKRHMRIVMQSAEPFAFAGHCRCGGPR